MSDKHTRGPWTLSPMKVWIVTYRIKIRRKWSTYSLAAESMEAADRLWDAIRSQAMSEQWEYDMLFKSDAQGNEVSPAPIEEGGTR